MPKVIGDVQPDLIVHAAAQPSHDLAAKRPFDDFDVNAVGTLNLLEATAQSRDANACDPVFVFMSTNKVYGDVPNELPLKELPTRWDYAGAEDYRRHRARTCASTAACTALFGASRRSRRT